MATHETGSLREDQLALTRERLLEAAALLLAEDQDLGFRAVAARAGVSAPTVYRHFDGPEALYAALLVHLERRLGVERHPRTIDEYVALLPELYASFQREERYMRAYLHAPKAVSTRERNWARRAASLRAILPTHPVLQQPELAARFAGILLALGSASTWHALVTVTDLRGADAGRVAGWAMRALVDAAVRDPDAFRAAFTRPPENPR